VIVHLYEELGPDFVSELNGMFALALWDDRRKQLTLARDRAGEKPLFYWHRDNTLVFASEIKSLLAYPAIGREIDRTALAQYFLHGYFPSPRSVFAEIRKLPAAHRMVIRDGKVQIDAYWRLQDHLLPPGKPRVTARQEEHLVDELSQKLHEACVSRLVSDVPLGVFLSGGIDSSTLVAMMSQLTPGNVNSFSVAFEEKSFNEEPYADYVARHFHTQHHVTTANEPSLREALKTLANHLDEPLADPAVLPTYLLSRFARQHIKVALSGEGSDELFGGYPTYIGAWLAGHYLRLPRFLRHQFFTRLKRFLPLSTGAVPLGWYLRQFFDYVEMAPAERHAIWFGLTSPEGLDQLFAPDWGGPESPSGEALAPLERVLGGATFECDLAEMLYLDFRLYLEDNLLVKVDRASMACSLEMRTPFLDHRLIEFAAGLPAELKVRGFRLKYLLKKAAVKWLPRKIVYRQKRGFSVPISRWMRRELRPWLDEALGEERLKRQGLFNAPYVRRLLEEHWGELADHRKLLWALFCFQLWYDRWGIG
jgi:asparagine synthase (glutamine-hydrolysing)